MKAGPASDATPEAPVAVLGGGVCGLYAALTLAKAGVPVTVLERGGVVGGLARGERIGRNVYDLGVHMLHAHDQGVFETVKQVMGDERVPVELDAQIRWAGSFYRYPLQFVDMVRGMDKRVLAHCVLGLLATEVHNKFGGYREPENAEEALAQLYGWPLYEFFFEEFTWRYWAIHPREISPLFVKSKMPRLSAADAIKKVLAKVGFKEKPGTSIDSALRQETLHYSRTGAEAMPRLLGAEIGRLGGKVVTGADVESVRTAGGSARSVVYRTPGDDQQHQLPCAAVINTTPLPDFTRAIAPAAPQEVLDATAWLRFKAIAIHGFLVRKEKALDAIYVYYRDRVFHRVCEPKNAGMVVDPPDHTVLVVETTCDPGDPKWRGDASVLRRIFADLEAEGVCTEDDVVERHLLRYEAGYPIYAKGFEPHFERVKAFVGSITNVRSTGRQGGFCFPAMHNAMRQGEAAARSLLGVASENSPENQRR